MSQNMTLKLVNPALKRNEIQTGLRDGNALNVELTNKSGFDTAFVGGEDGADLLVRIPTTILDAKAAASIAVAEPWTLCGIEAPTGGTGDSAGGDAIVLKLTPPPSPGIAFAANDTVEIPLSHVAPTAKGSATVQASYDFADLGLKMVATDQLNVLGPVSPDRRTLIGPDAALLYGLRVNGGPPENPVIKSVTPVTRADAVQNRLQLNFVFQAQPTGDQDDASLGRLVNGWDQLNPPTFRVWFPYFNATSSLPAPLTLTDDAKETDPTYNAFTSAWNIKLSLSSTDPDITSNDWWTVTRDPRSLSPSWRVQPTPANTYLFTGAKTDSPGPFLDLYLSHVYTGLGIDPSQPETLIYLETYDFPGFNDRLIQRPLYKEDSIDIMSFSGRIDLAAGLTTLELSWQTTGKVDYCLVSGFSERQGAQSDGAFRKKIDLTTRLASGYTLTAVGNDKIAKVYRSVPVQWTEGPHRSTLALNYPSALAVAPDGETLFVAGNNVVNVMNPKTLLGQKVLNIENALVRNVVASPDGTRLFVAAQTTTGSDSFVAAYTVELQPIDAPQMNPGVNSAAEIYPMAVSADSAQLALTVATPPGDEAPRIVGYDTSTLKPDPKDASPAEIATLRPMGVTFRGDQLLYPDKGGLGVLDRTTFKPVQGSPVSLGSGSVTAYTPGPMALSPDGKSLATLARGMIGGARAFVLCLVDMENMKLRQRVQVEVGYGFAPPVPTTWAGFSNDGKLLFVFGTDYSTAPPNLQQTIFKVYDPDTLKEVPWTVSPSAAYGDAAMAPDGSRIYLTSVDTGGSLSGHLMELVPQIGPASD
jgi:hypothetical protein